MKPGSRISQVLTYEPTRCRISLSTPSPMPHLLNLLKSPQANHFVDPHPSRLIHPKSLSVYPPRRQFDRHQSLRLVLQSLSGRATTSQGETEPATSSGLPCLSDVDRSVGPGPCDRVLTAGHNLEGFKTRSNVHARQYRNSSVLKRVENCRRSLHVLKEDYQETLSGKK